MGYSSARSSASVCHNHHGSCWFWRRQLTLWWRLRRRWPKYVHCKLQIAYSSLRKCTYETPQAIQTIITVVYILVTFFFLPIAYNYWAVLGLDVLGVIFWLCSFAVLSSEVQNYKSDFDNFGGGDDCFDGLCFKRSIIQKRFVTFNNYYHTMTALAVFGAFQL